MQYNLTDANAKRAGRAGAALVGALGLILGGGRVWAAAPQGSTADAVGGVLSDFLEGWTVGAYGEVLTSTQFYGPDPNEQYPGFEYHDTTVDLARVVFVAGYDFTDWLSFATEVEIEHGGTGSTMELEWDEFGEYELEVEKGGEVVLEQAYLEARLGRHLSLKAGHLLVPVGTISAYHLPTYFSTTRRSEGEERLLPSAWHETGLEVAGTLGGFTAQLQVMTGLDSTGFSSNQWIGGGMQGRFETVKANALAAALRLDWHGIPGLLVGVSAYTTDAAGNRPKRDLVDTEARLVLGDLHLRFQAGPVRVRGLLLMGWLDGADLITDKNSRLASALGVPRTPVGGAAYAWNLEAAFDVVWGVNTLFGTSSRHRLDLFGRVDDYDTMWKPPVAGGYDNPLLHRRTLTVGLNYLPHPRVILKGEYLHRWLDQDGAWARQQKEVNFDLGFTI